MGSSSSSRTNRTYNTTNVSQQGEGNVYGKGNRVTIQRADALTLDRIARALGAGVEDITRALRDGTSDVTEAGVKQVERTLTTAKSINADALNMAEDVNADSLSAIEGTAGQAIKLAREVAQASENGTQSAMDFVANYTEREQVGSEGEQLRTLQYVAAAVAVALVGIAWASKGRMTA